MAGLQGLDSEKITSMIQNIPPLGPVFLQHSGTSKGRAKAWQFFYRAQPGEENLVRAKDAGAPPHGKEAADPVHHPLTPILRKLGRLCLL